MVGTQKKINGNEMKRVKKCTINSKKGKCTAIIYPTLQKYDHIKQWIKYPKTLIRLC